MLGGPALFWDIFWSLRHLIYLNMPEAKHILHQFYPQKNKKLNNHQHKIVWPFLLYIIHIGPIKTEKTLYLPDLAWLSLTIPDLYPLYHRGFVYSNDPLSWVVPFKTKIYGELHEYLWFYISLLVGHNRIYWLGAKLSDNSQRNYDPDRHTIDPWWVGLPLIHPLLLHASMGTQAGFFLRSSHLDTSFSRRSIYTRWSYYHLTLFF